MFNGIKIHFRVFKMLIKTSFIKNLNYRANLLMLFLDSLIWLILTLAFFNVIYANIPHINGWTLNDMYILIGVADFIKSMLFAFFMQGMTRLPNLVRSGDLDTILTKPVNSQLLISFSEFNISGALNLIPSILLVIYGMAQKGQTLSLPAWGFFAAALTCAVVMCYSIWYIILTLSMWMKNSGNLNELFISFLTMMRYPSGIYKGVLGTLLLGVMPIVLASNLPATILAGNYTPGKLIPLALFSVGYLVFSQLFWRFSLKFYNSTSS